MKSLSTNKEIWILIYKKQTSQSQIKQQMINKLLTMENINEEWHNEIRFLKMNPKKESTAEKNTLTRASEYTYTRVRADARTSRRTKTRPMNDNTVHICGIVIVNILTT